MWRKPSELVPVLISSCMELILCRRACVGEPPSEAALCELAPCSRVRVWRSPHTGQLLYKPALHVLVPAWRSLLGVWENF